MKPYITCEELIAFLGDYIAGELPPGKQEDFERHLAVCASCVAYIASYRETIRLAREAAGAPELRVADVPDELIAAILAATRGPD